ncbi:follistatin-like isoform X2 [Mobula hypostoma]|uniref:follistatin-like isoform X2 n=1 Tax=Mobula hypostoma TaxID=723540 RepID=UPI002FC380B1
MLQMQGLEFRGAEPENDSHGFAVSRSLPSTLPCHQKTAHQTDQPRPFSAKIFKSDCIHSLTFIQLCDQTRLAFSDQYLSAAKLSATMLRMLSNRAVSRVFLLSIFLTIGDDRVQETCDNVDCGPGKRCKMNKKNKPRCVCAPDCSNVTWKGSVCGTDGKTYKDECVLLKARCKGHPELEVQYQGKCRKTCRDVLCPGSSVCVVDQTNSAYCVMCNTRICPEPSSPEQYLCGNDGITYASACHIRRATCLMGRSIGVAYEGKCIKAKSCEDIECSSGKKCLWDRRLGRGRCVVCNVCQGGRSDEPVCATDNTTYPNECEMKNSACSSGTLLEIKHTGSCNSITEEEEDEEDEQENNIFPKSAFPIW